MNLEKDLLVKAKAVRLNAHTPYSGFKVGAVIRSGENFFVGANVENASYGLSRCAEQSAVQAMVSAGVTNFDEILVYTEADTPASPCGSCRQILFEFAPDAKVTLVNHLGTVKKFTVKELLPEGFSFKVDTTDT